MSRIRHVRGLGHDGGALVWGAAAAMPSKAASGCEGEMTRFVQSAIDSGLNSLSGPSRARQSARSPGASQRRATEGKMLSCQAAGNRPRHMGHIDH